MRRLLLVAGGIAAVVAGTSRPAVADVQAVVAWACEKDADKADTIKQLLLDACNMAEAKDDKNVCDVVSGTPFACNTKKEKEHKLACVSGSGSFEASGGDSGFGWSVEGDIKVKATSTYSFEGKKCDIAPIIPLPTGGPGKFVRVKGTAKVSINITAKGEGKFKILGITFYSETINEKCSNEMEVSTANIGETIACGTVITTCCDPMNPACDMSQCEEPACADPYDPACGEPNTDYPAHVDPYNPGKEHHKSNEPIHPDH